MNGKNIYTGNINTEPTFVPNKPTEKDNSKYIATIISENLRKNSIDTPDYQREIAKREREKAKLAKQAKVKNEKERKVTTKNEELLKMSIDYDLYDFNEWNKKIVDAYNPYAVDDEYNSSLSNYEKIKRIVDNEKRQEKNFIKFNENLDDIYADIKEKITNETLKTIYGEDSFEYIPKAIEEYRQDWTTGDENADLLLKLYHSPKIKQRDISASQYIAEKYSNFVKSIDGKETFEVSKAKIGFSPSDIVRVNLEKPYYMDDESLKVNKEQQDAYIEYIMKNGGAKNGVNNRFVSNKKPPFGPPAAPGGLNAPPAPVPPTFNNAADNTNQDNNLFVPQSEESQVASIETLERKVPRRKEWVSPGSIEQAKQLELEERINLINNETDNQKALDNIDIVENQEMKVAATTNQLIEENKVIEENDQEIKKPSNFVSFSSTVETKSKEPKNNTTSKGGPSANFKYKNIEVLSNTLAKQKSLAEVLAEKRNKNHKQMDLARANKKMTLQDAINNLSDNQHIDRGFKKKK